MRLFLISCIVLAAVSNTQSVEAATVLLGHKTVAGSAHMTGSMELQQRLSAVAISPTFIGLIVTSLVVILCITLLLIKYRKNTHKIEKLHSRVRGLNHSLIMEEVKLCKDKEKEAALRAMLNKEKDTLAEYEAADLDTASRIEASNQQLSKDRAIIATQKAEIKFLSAEEKALINDIVKRGRVQVDLEKQAFKFAQPIEFAAEYITPDMEEAPPARFENPALAREVIGDLALIMNYVKAIVLVEGHTQGGEQAMSYIGFQIASERAEKVVETLLEFGVERKCLEAKGMPGLLGDNKSDVKLVTLSWGMK
jgi:hypothetical protein